MNRKTFVAFIALSLVAVFAPGCGGGDSDSDPATIVTGVSPKTFFYNSRLASPYGGEPAVLIDVQIQGRNFRSTAGVIRYTARVDGAMFAAEAVPVINSNTLQGTLHVPVSLLSPEGSIHNLSVYDAIENVRVTTENENATKITITQAIDD